MDQSARIFISGHNGLLGHALVEELKSAGYKNIITSPKEELDLTHQQNTYDFLKNYSPDVVIHAAALVGGIHDNLARPASFSQENLNMQANVIHGSHLADVKKLLFFGSNCMYPLGAPQPMPEEELLQGPIEPSNLAYGSAKLAGYVQCESYHKQYGRDYFTIIPASFYGPHDNYDLDRCHVTPALIRRFHMAKKQKDKSFSVWGTGKPRRELLYVGDAARGVRLLMENWSADQGPVNLGAGEDISVQELAETIKEVVGFEGELVNDLSKPDGNPRKLLDSTRIQKIGFKPQVNLKEGLHQTYKWLLSGSKVRGVETGEF